MRAISEIRKGFGSQGSRLLAEYEAQKYLVNQVENWQRKDFKSIKLKDGRHLATSLLALQIQPVTQHRWSSIEILERKLAAYAILGRLVSTFTEINAGSLESSTRNLAAASYMILAFCTAISNLLEDTLIERPNSCWDLSHVESTSIDVMVQYIQNIFDSELWTLPHEYSEELCPILQKLLSLFMLGSAIKIVPDSWKSTITPISDRYFTNLDYSLRSIPTDNSIGLAKIHPGGPSDLTTTYALGLCAIENNNYNFARELLAIAHKNYKLPSLQATASALTWNLAILLELKINPEILLDTTEIEREVKMLKNNRTIYSGTAINKKPFKNFFRINTLPELNSNWSKINILTQINLLSIVDEKLAKWCNKYEHILEYNLALTENTTDEYPRSILLIGPSCSGKTTLALLLSKLKHFHCLKRYQDEQSKGNDRSSEDEMNSGIELISKNEFTKLLENNYLLYNYTSNSINYGYSKSDLIYCSDNKKIPVLQLGSNLQDVIGIINILMDVPTSTLLILMKTPSNYLNTRIVKRYKINEREEIFYSALNFYRKCDSSSLNMATIDNTGSISYITSQFSEIIDRYWEFAYVSKIVQSKDN